MISSVCKRREHCDGVTCALKVRRVSDSNEIRSVHLPVGGSMAETANSQSVSQCYFICDTISVFSVNRLILVPIILSFALTLEGQLSL